MLQPLHSIAPTLLLLKHVVISYTLKGRPHWMKEPSWPTLAN